MEKGAAAAIRDSLGASADWPGRAFYLAWAEPRKPLTGAGPTDQIAQNGIQVSFGATATVSGNTVSGKCALRLKGIQARR